MTRILKAAGWWSGREAHWVFVWGPLLVLPTLTWAVVSYGTPRWAGMWMIAGAIFAGVKWSSWWEWRGRMPAVRSALYLFAWPGMDPAPFAAPACPGTPATGEWLWALVKVALGTGLIALAVRLPHGLTEAWVGMVGIIFVAHFGGAHLLALIYRRRGLPVQPLMCNPAVATSLGNLWGARWNRGFRDWAFRMLFQPAERRLGRAGAAAWVFLVSGLLHEAAISLPAGGGYGGPTAYFLLQGAGTIAERSAWGRRHGLRHGWRGRVFTLAVAGLPLGLLFHPPFAYRVILPFLEALRWP